MSRVIPNAKLILAFALTLESWFDLADADLTTRRRL